MADWKFDPARDHGMSPVDRLRSVRREPGLVGLLTAGTSRRLVRLYLRLFHGFRVEGAENLPPAPFVLVANHSSHLDALCLLSALPGALARRAFALAAGDTFFSSVPLAALASYALGALPVWRKRTSAGDLREMRARLHEGGAVLVLFPEGTRSRDGRMNRFQPGVAALVGGTEVPVVPCFLEGAFESWPPDRRLPRPGVLRLRIGPPLRFPAMAPGRAGLEAATAECEAAVRRLG